MAPRPRLWIALLSAMALTNQLSVNIVRPATTYKVDELGGDTTVVGLIAAAYAVVPLVSAMSVGRLAQRLPALSGLMAGGFLTMMAGAAAIALSPAVWAMFAGTALLGFGQLVFTIGGQSAVGRIAGERRLDSGFGWFTAGVSAGQMLGPPTAGWIMVRPDSAPFPGGSDAAIAFGGLVVLPALAVLAASVLRSHKGTGTATGGASPTKGVPHGSGPGSRPEHVSARQVLRRPGVGSHVVASSGLLALTDILVAFVPLLGEEAGLSPVVVGLLLAMRGVGSLLSRVLLGTLTARVRRETLLTASLVCSAASFTAFPFTLGHPGAAGVLMVIGGFFLGLGQPLTMSMVALAVPPGWRPPALALRLVGNRLGQVVVPVAAGAIAAPAGPAGAVWLGSGLLMVSVAERRFSPGRRKGEES